MKARQQAAGRYHRESKAVLLLFVWTAAWVLTLALAQFGHRFLWQSDVATLLAVIFNFAIGLGMIRANVLYLRAMDELMQKIQLQAMGLALGIGIVGGLTYALLDTTNLVAFDAEIGIVVMMMGLTYAGAIFAGHRYYR